MGVPFEFDYVIEYFIKLLSALDITLVIVASSLVLGLLFGLCIALPQMYNIPVLKQLSKVYISFFRGTPVLIQLFLFYYGLPELLKVVGLDTSRVPVLYFVILTYALHSGAYMSEMIRAAISAVERGQTEAAYAIGMTRLQSFFRIVIPQAFAVALPVLANLVIGNLKDTSLAFTLGVMELTGKSQTLAVMSRHFIETYISLAILYFIISFILEKLFHLLEKRMKKRGLGLA